MRDNMLKFFLYNDYALSKKLIYAYVALVCPVIFYIGIVALIFNYFGFSMPTDVGEISNSVLLIVSPFTESVMLIFFLNIIIIFVKRKFIACIFASIVFGVLHADPYWRFVTGAWGFFVFSNFYMSLRARSFWLAFSMTVLLHSLGNFTGYLIGVLGAL